ncbi:MAG: hypothetical protein R3B84_13610 [Zavarzinella sp.]
MNNKLLPLTIRKEEELKTTFPFRMHTAWSFVFLVNIVVTFTPNAWADVIILKDGYTIHGKALKEKATIRDPISGDAFVTDKADGLTMIDDGARYVIIPQRQQLGDIGANDRFQAMSTYTYQGKFFPGNLRFPGNVHSPEVGSWDYANWRRNIKYIDGDKPAFYHLLKQQITLISPHYIYINSWSHFIQTSYLTKEFPIADLRGLLQNHPDLVEKANEVVPARRERLFRFWLQAELYDEADVELKRLQKDAPQEVELIQKLTAELNEARYKKILDAITVANKANRHEWVQQQLKQLNIATLPENSSIKVATWKAEYETLEKKQARMLHQLKLWSSKLDGADPTFLKPAVAALQNEIHLSALTRLDTFLTLAEQAERDVQSGREPTQTPAELLSAAITGWHLGKIGAEANTTTANKVWNTRLMALEYLAGGSPRERQVRMEKYLASDLKLPYDELEKVIEALPPPLSPEMITTEPSYQNTGPLVNVPEGVRYFLKLPKEYHPSRPHPLLVLLPEIGQLPHDMVREMGNMASDHGYILVCPIWYEKNQPFYMHSVIEQTKVMQFIRSVRRTYQVDADRTALWGFRNGASLAMDLGASHPDIFSAIVAYIPNLFTDFYINSEYWLNYQNLPLYIVSGQRAGHTVPGIQMAMSKFSSSGFPAITSIYKGRSSELYKEEIPFIIDWLDRKKRVEIPQRIALVLDR